MLPKADRYIMQETHHKINRYNAYKFYQVYMKEVAISAIILSYLTMLNCKLGKKLADFTSENCITSYNIFMIELFYTFFRQYKISDG